MGLEVDQQGLSHGWSEDDESVCRRTKVTSVSEHGKMRRDTNLVPWTANSGKPSMFSF